MDNEFQLFILFYFFIIFGLCLVLSFRFYEDYLCNIVSLCLCYNAPKELPNIEESKIDCV